MNQNIAANLKAIRTDTLYSSQANEKTSVFSRIKVSDPIFKPASSTSYTTSNVTSTGGGFSRQLGSSAGTGKKINLVQNEAKPKIIPISFEFPGRESTSKPVVSIKEAPTKIQGTIMENKKIQDRLSFKK